jgi:glycosyltransferase involved in cell wall biosynthesis
MPRRIVREVLAVAGGRVTVVGPCRHLAPNAARSIGLRSATARYVVFIDNDVVPSPGWLEALTRTAMAHDAWVVRPLVLQRHGGEVTVHESGGECHLEEHDGVVTLVETHRHLGCQLDEVRSLHTEEVELFEFHAVLFDRARLVALGGPDERVRSVGDHLDLALRVRAAGGSVWFEPAAEIAYVVPHRLALRDYPFFLGRWSPSWTVASRTTFLTEHGVNDPDDPHETWLFPELHRAYAWLPVGRLASLVTRRPITRGVAKRFDRFVGRHLATAVQRFAPRWRGGGLEALR